ncbi:hypothetical protein B0H94_11843 [Salsuginibacillus halophilus]|uniref:Uncharacterized protein n=1 Tax=Salsuginibacillus halophilus TaxID=517424 RepID=A0A2P8H6A5_9BACI|nr:hypothetical protein [Salsuginibacillus halophilus]PSL41730.1 hypothetical protein B0H94_11843 [Salsuginibacillus halophilus]
MRSELDNRIAGTGMIEPTYNDAEDELNRVSGKVHVNLEHDSLVFDKRDDKRWHELNGKVKTYFIDPTSI